MEGGMTDDIVDRAHIYLRRDGAFGAACGGTLDTGYRIFEDSGYFTVYCLDDGTKPIAENATRQDAEDAIAVDWRKKGLSRRCGATGQAAQPVTDDIVSRLRAERGSPSVAHQAAFDARALYLDIEAALARNTRARFGLEAANVDAGLLAAAAYEIERLRMALADAIRRPMGVIPASAEGLITSADLDAAEKRRPRT
jgi:hypothetical protein